MRARGGASSYPKRLPNSICDVTGDVSQHVQGMSMYLESKLRVSYKYSLIDPREVHFILLTQTLVLGFSSLYFLILTPEGHPNAPLVGLLVVLCGIGQVLETKIRSIQTKGSIQTRGSEEVNQISQNPTLSQKPKWKAIGRFQPLFHVLSNNRFRSR